MDDKMLALVTETEEEEESQFSTDEIAVFKRYIEENVVSTNNNFEFLEENLAYYSTRYTSEHYFSPAEYFHANSNLVLSDEMKTNLDLYEKAVEWHSSTVHPEGSEYVVKQEKYNDLEGFPEPIQNLVSFLNQYEKREFFVVDLLFYVDGEIYQYLPGKNFLFKWKSNAHHLREKLENSLEDVKLDIDEVVVFPIFTPIRKMLFLGEYGYRSSLIEYGRITEIVRSYLREQKYQYRHVDVFENHKMNHTLRLDGIERSIHSLFTFTL